MYASRTCDRSSKHTGIKTDCACIHCVSNTDFAFAMSRDLRSSFRDFCLRPLLVYVTMYTCTSLLVVANQTEVLNHKIG